METEKELSEKLRIGKKHIEEISCVIKECGWLKITESLATSCLNKQMMFFLHSKLAVQAWYHHKRPRLQLSFCPVFKVLA